MFIVKVFNIAEDRLVVTGTYADYDSAYTAYENATQSVDR